MTLFHSGHSDSLSDSYCRCRCIFDVRICRVIGFSGLVHAIRRCPSWSASQLAGARPDTRWKPLPSGAGRPPILLQTGAALPAAVRPVRPTGRRGREGGGGPTFWAVRSVTNRLIHPSSTRLAIASSRPTQRRRRAEGQTGHSADQLTQYLHTSRRPRGDSDERWPDTARRSSPKIRESERRAPQASTNNAAQITQPRMT